MRLTREGSTDVLSFRSYTEAVEFANVHSHEDRDAIDSSRSSQEFTETKNYGEAHNLATRGWSEGRRKVAEFAQHIDVTAMVAKPEPVYDVIGEGGIDVGAYLSGIPECMLDWRETERAVEFSNGSDIVKIVFNGSVSGGVETDYIKNRGAAVLALIDALETAGKRVELIYMKVNSVSGEAVDGFRIEIPLKTPEFAVQPDQLAFALIHPSMNRRIGFSLTHQCGTNGLRASTISHGGVTTWVPEDADVWLPRLDYKNSHLFDSVANAKQWVLDCLNRLGVKLNDQ